MHHSVMSYEDLKSWFNFKYLKLCIWKVYLQFENANVLIALITFWSIKWFLVNLQRKAIKWILNFVLKF